MVSPPTPFLKSGKRQQVSTISVTWGGGWGWGGGDVSGEGVPILGEELEKLPLGGN